MILQPQAWFPIARQIANHLDTNTYYVRAKVYDADGNLLDTVQLEDKGGQRFQKRYRVPVDRSGQGAYISIVTSVYTDSNYTTKSSNYGDEENTYLIFDRVTAAMRGGGSNYDISEVRRVISEELDAREKDEKEIEFPTMPEVPNYDAQLQSLSEAIASLTSYVSKLPTESTDLEPVLFGIQRLADAIANKEVTPVTDLMPVLSVLDDVMTAIDTAQQTTVDSVENVTESTVNAVLGAVEEAVGKTKFISQFMTFAAPDEKVKPEQMQKPKFNMRKLVS